MASQSEDYITGEMRRGKGKRARWKRNKRTEEDDTQNRTSSSDICAWCTSAPERNQNMSMKRAHGYWNRVGVTRPFSPFVLVERACFIV